MLDSSPDFESFMEELKAQSVGHCFSCGYFRRSAQLGPFDMFSDVDSRISHLNKIGQMVRLLCLANLLIGVTNTFSGASLAWLNLLCATFLAYGLGRISSKRESLVEERTPRVTISPLEHHFSEFSKVQCLPACVPMQRYIIVIKQIVTAC